MTSRLNSGTLATLQARDGRLHEADEALETIRALEPENAEAANLLAEVRHRLAAREAVRS